MKRSLRAQYQRVLQRVLLRDYRGFKVEHLSGSPDLEHSFSPVYTRAVLRSGQSAFAVLGVNAEEAQASVDAVLSFGILWMDYQRQQLAGRAHVEGLKLFLPPGRSEIVRQRAAQLNAEAAKWQIYELDERSEICEPVDCADSGNVITRLTRAVDAHAARERFAASIARIHALAPAAEITIESASEIVFRLYGLEFARACITPVSGSFRNAEAILFGIGPAEYVLDENSQALFSELVQRITEQRRPGRLAHQPLLPPCPRALAGNPDHARRSRHRRAARWTLRVFAGAGVYRFRPRHARRAHVHPRWPAGHPGAEGR